MILEAVKDVNHLAQTAVFAAIEVEGDPLKLEAILIGNLFRSRFDGSDLAVDQDVRKVFIEGGDGGVAGLIFKADDELLFHKASAVKVAIESGDEANRFVRAVGDLIEVEVVRGDKFIAEKVFADLLVPGFPIGAAGTVN